MTDTSKRQEHDDGRIRIWVNSGAKMSRGKYAAAAVHAALAAAGVHPGVPVIVLGGDRDQIESLRTVIHDAGRTEVEPGTATAGTDYVFEQAHTPTDDERGSLSGECLLGDHEACDGTTPGFPCECRCHATGEDFRRTAVQEPSDEPTVRDHVRDLTGATDAELDELGGLQDEPSDATLAVQNVARIIAAAASDWNHNDCGDDDHHLGHSNWGAYIDDARAALRAAYEEGKKR